MKNIYNAVFSALLLLGTMTAQAIPLVYTASLSGANEPVPNASPGSGTAKITLDDVLNTMRVEVVFADLLGSSTVAHIHCCTTDPGVGGAGVASAIPTFPGFPAGVTSGLYDQIFDTTDVATFNATFVASNGGTAAGALAALKAGLDAGKAYLNVHSSRFPSGEISGFPLAAAVPAPGTLALLGLALLTLGLRGRDFLR